MCDLLSFEADRRAVNITINRWSTEFSVSDLASLFWHGHLPQYCRYFCVTFCSIGTELTRDDRRKLYSNFGLLYVSLKAKLVIFLVKAFLFLMWMNLIFWYPSDIHMVMRNLLFVKMLIRFVSNRAQFSWAAFFIQLLNHLQCSELILHF
jgi:hypothetical protein